VKETLSKTAGIQHLLCADRSRSGGFPTRPMCCRARPAGIPVVSVQHHAVGGRDLSIGRRNMLADRSRNDFQTNIDRYDFERLSKRRAPGLVEGLQKVG